MSKYDCSKCARLMPSDAGLMTVRLKRAISKRRKRAPYKRPRREVYAMRKMTIDYDTRDGEGSD